MLRVSIVMPAFNESNRITRVVREALKSRYSPEVLVVDDGSTVGTAEAARAAGAKVYRHNCNRGKGAAVRSGVKHSKGEVLLFLDADLENITAAKIDSLVKPVVSDEADFVKAGFRLARGRVTEIAVKPLLRLLNRDLGLSQPISGQFCARREFMETAQYSDGWGVDIELIIEAAESGQRIAEVDLGELKHKKQPLAGKALMSQVVMKKILQRHGLLAGRFKLVAFDLDETLVGERTIDAVAFEWGFLPELKKWRDEFEAGKITENRLNERIAREFRGRTRRDVEAVLEKVPLRSRAFELVRELKKRNYAVAMITMAFDPIARFYAEKLGITRAVSRRLAKKGRTYTGRVKTPFSHGKHGMDKGRALESIAASFGTSAERCVFVGNGSGDVPALKAAGLGVAITPSEPEAEAAAQEKIDSLSELLLVL